MSKNFTLGCDPEMFFTDHNDYISLIGKVGGSKGNPIPLIRGGGVQEDNVALEFNTAPAISKIDFITKVKNARDDVITLAKRLGASVSTSSYAMFPPNVLTDAKALEFGCDPDINAWNLEFNPIPNLQGQNLRTAGGHVHIGWEYTDDVERINLARLLDIFHGLPSVVEDGSCNMRRRYYGMAGAHRAKPYGIESRILSNYWIFNDRQISRIYDRVKQAMRYVESPEKILGLVDPELLITTINNGDKPQARLYINEVQNFMGEAL